MNPYVVAGVAATGFLVADDATVVGIADDIFIPVVWTGLGVAALVEWVFFSDKSTQSKPTDAPPGTKPIDQSGLGRKNTHTVKDGVGAGPKDWTGIAPNGDVITSGPDGKHINHGPWDTYLP